MKGVEKYLARYAEPEAALASNIAGSYAASLVVPALGESVELLEGYRAAARGVNGRVLVILVVNARRDAAPAFQDANRRLLAEVGCAPRPMKMPDFDVIAVDRSSHGRELPRKQGVGLARKIGMDLALALFVSGKVLAPWLFGTDADAKLPGDFFERALTAPAGSSALLYPFAHEGGDDVVESATLQYEASLRYHVLGLASAGSPYAYQSVGSAVTVRAETYAAVRGVPKREAGEDFYLLDKLAKIAPVTRLAGPPVAIRARRSSRAPFGTGPAVSAILEHGEIAVAHPAAFAALGRLLEALDVLASERDWKSFRARMAAAASEPTSAPDGRRSRTNQAGADSLAVFLEQIGMFEACRNAVSAVGYGNLRRRLHTWFDAGRTLRVLHALRASGLNDLPLTRAVELAPFAPASAGLGAEALLARLAELERRMPARIGPTLLE